ncbi:signal recognition particle receptor alpha subunit [Cardiosporidium cionae]|uniref:Signal recognition particle receptor alpha subunit n=1 Tax=Cardiosporidium cionae TaxID=476202 RepID=A0ABQ7JAH7_9APIC|nr:signal recognition particle receptor alpha subunit [Cardiosporidium cionae]|eukprot:KAF8821007.1 signal recognition particle receptor alpha subunit [Cardiosporidium cionae]
MQKYRTAFPTLRITFSALGSALQEYRLRFEERTIPSVKIIFDSSKMIDAISIFTKGGVVLWSYFFIKLKENPFDRLIKTILLEERAGEPFAFLPPFNVKWKLVNDLNLIFVVAYQGLKQLLYIEMLLESVKSEFLAHIGGYGKYRAYNDIPDFAEKFKKIQRKCDDSVAHTSRAILEQPTMAMQKNGKNGPIVKNKQSSRNGKLQINGSTDENLASANEDDENNEKVAKEIVAPISEPTIMENQQKLLGKLRRDIIKKGNVSENAPATKDTKQAKRERVWGFTQKVTKKDMEALDFSKNKISAKEAPINPNIYADSSEETVNYDSENEFSDDDEEVSHDEEAKLPRTGLGSIFGKVTATVNSLLGNKQLNKEDLDPILEEFKVSLMTKNVSGDIAEMIINSVKSSLLEQKSERFTSVRSTVKNAIFEAIQRVLSPKKSTDVLRAALEAKQKGIVYSIVFLGVNGVGKSTNLAKVCYYLKNKGGMKVMLAACDTFRSGAVEQLQHHAKCLDVFLFERGYGKDAAEIAFDALSYARNNGYDVVLIDTAGRMQDNTPLMRALAKLVVYNNPDLILFVGEALVGNDGVDQVQKFNQCLIDMTAASIPRSIDGILLTKFDTVGDKIGAALSMVYATSQPIIFVGTGQKYPHLQKLNAKNVVRLLLG